MKKVLLVVGTLALAFLAAPVHSQPFMIQTESLIVHLSKCIEVNLADDLPVRLPIRIDLARIRIPPDLRFTCFDCYTGPFGDFEPLSLRLRNDFAVSLSSILAFE